jgi:hypothetical protein
MQKAAHALQSSHQGLLHALASVDKSVDAQNLTAALRMGVGVRLIVDNNCRTWSRHADVSETTQPVTAYSYMDISHGICFLFIPCLICFIMLYH